MATDTTIDVLLIEDNPTDVRLVQEVLRGTPSDHFNIIIASTLAQGLEHLNTDHVDIILLDLGLPDCQGFDTFHAIEGRAPDLPVIILTITANEELGMAAIRAGAQRFFSKDVLTPDGAYAEMFPQIIHYAIEHKRVEAELQQSKEQAHKLNKRLNAANKELSVANEELQRRRQKDAEELSVVNKQLQDSCDELRSASEYTRKLIEASLDPLVTISPGGVITDVNKATEDVTGYPREKLIGSDFSAYFTEPEQARRVYLQVLIDGFVKDYPLVIRHKSGKATEVLYNASVYRNDVGMVQGVFAAARDVTKLRRAERNIQEYSTHLEELVEKRTAQLEDAHRLAAIGQTAAMIGHDLRNPLQGLQYIVDLQKLRFERMSAEMQGTKEWQQQQALFDRISEQVYYMDKIVGDLQDYARPIEPEYETVALDKLIDSVLHSLPRDSDVEITSDLNDLTIEADPHLIRRVFSNLILNALQAMPDGGTLAIHATADGDSVSISIRDTGVGIPQDIKDTLFSPLTTGKAKGTGLGLAVVKRIIEAHAGTITFESEEGEGATFIVTMPASGGR